ncbi:MAG: hypothetical protein QXV69_06355 [Sulfolobaceae archaeon]
MQELNLVRRENEGFHIYTSTSLSKYFFLKYFSDPSRILTLLFDIKDLRKVSEGKWVLNSEYEVLRILNINSIEYTIYKKDKMLCKVKFMINTSNSGTLLEFVYEDYTRLKWFRTRKFYKKFNELLRLLNTIKDMKCTLP